MEFVDTLQSEETIEAERSTKKETISDERKKSVFDTPKVETPKRETKDEKSTPKVVKPSPVSVEKIKEMDSKGICCDNLDIELINLFLFRL